MLSREVRYGPRNPSPSGGPREHPGKLHSLLAAGGIVNEEVADEEDVDKVDEVVSYDNLQNVQSWQSAE